MDSTGLHAEPPGIPLFLMGHPREEPARASHVSAGCLHNGRIRGHIPYRPGQHHAFGIPFTPDLELGHRRRYFNRPVFLVGGISPDPSYPSGPNGPCRGRPAQHPTPRKKNPGKHCRGFSSSKGANSLGRREKWGAISH
jgi:hypothetical protein